MNISGTRVVLVILDGYGISPEEENNAVFLANTPNLDRLFSRFIFLAESGANCDMMMARLDETDKSVNADAFKSKGTHEY